MEKLIKSAVVSVASTSLSDEEKRLLNKFNPLGVTLFQRNIENKEQIKNIIKEIKEAIERDDVLIAIDQEGGRVARLKPPYFRNYLSQRSIGSLENFSKKKREAYLHALLIADELSELGINVNYAPCVDVLYDTTARVLKTRCLSSDEHEVSILAEQMLNAYKSMGIIPCLKHAPGHGRAVLDPHLELPIIEADKDLLQKDFYPFKYLAELTPMMMTAHIVLKSIDDKPITQSKKAIDEIIRSEIGFNGFLISDAIDMKALKGSLGEKTQTSLKAGCDAVCYCMGQVDELNEVLQSACFLEEDSFLRYEHLKRYLSYKSENRSLKKEADEYNLIAQKALVFKEDYDAVETLNQLLKK